MIPAIRIDFLSFLLFTLPWNKIKDEDKNKV